jgi:sigma-B regulation protein RsbU (phosphoserine phosphatase)
LVVIADVAGKGIPAALYMSKVQGMVQFAAHMYNSPKDMLINVNRRIYDGIERNSFVTMILASFDMEKKEVRICRAGHNKALVKINGEFKYIDASGIGVGLEKGPIFENSLEEIRLPIHTNSLFVFYTDGLTEAMNEKRDEFGEEAVRNIVKDNHNLTGESLQSLLLKNAEEFRGTAEQHDDITLTIIKSK